MFTGLVEEIGTVRRIWTTDKGLMLSVDAEYVLNDVKVSDSISINGVCLTVTTVSADSLVVGIALETQRRTNLGNLQPGDFVNLERSLPFNGRVGGHFVQGHVDGTGVIMEMSPEDESLWVKVEASEELLKYMVPKGFVSVDGVSLTVVNVFPNAFDFMLISYSQEHVILPRKIVGELVNLEVDLLGKYVERFVEGITHAIYQN
jgi:riboflavin synthase